MSAVFPVAEDVRWRSHTASAGQTVFPIPYVFQDNADITVQKIAIDGTVTTLAYPAAYSLAGAGNPAGGSYTLVTAAQAGEKYLSIGAAVMSRVLSIVRDGKFASGATDADLDRALIRDLEQRRDLARAVKVAFGAAEQALPTPGADGQVVGWTGSELVNLSGSGLPGELLPATAQRYLRRNAGGTAFEALTARAVRSDINRDVGYYGVIGNVDDRSVLQASLDALAPGGVFELPEWAEASILNGVGSGANLTAQRAHAVANGGLRRLTCDKDDITVVIAGKVHMLSALDHLFEFSGKRVRVIASGEISGPGVYHTVNSDDPTLQWRPSLIRVTGAGSVVEATNLRHAPTVGLWIDASHCDATVTHTGGPAADPGGTVLFGAYVGSPSGASRDLNRVRLRARIGDDGGKLLTGVFSAGKDNDFSDMICDGAWQHAGYAYGDNPTFDNCRIAGVVQAAGIQHFGRGFRALGGTVKNSYGALALNDATGARVAGIEAVIGMKNGISVATSIFANPATDVIEDLSISECHLRADKTLAARNSTLNVTLNTPFVGLSITGNHVHAGPHADLANVFGRASISVGVLDTAVGPGRELSITGNHVYDSDEYAVLVQRVTDGEVDGNRIRNANANISYGTSAVRFRKCDRVSFVANTVRDVRGSPYTELMLLATTGDTNTAIACYDNNAVGLALGAQTRLAALPTVGGVNTRTSRNRVDGHMPIARITFPTATTTKTYTSADHAAIAGIRSGADVWLEPYGLGAAEQQQGAHRIYVKTVAAGSVTLETYDAGNTTASCAFNLCWAQ